LAEAALLSGFEGVDIVSYPLDVLKASGLPLKPLDTIPPYSAGIEVHRPEPLGDYKVVEGRIGLGISGKIIDLMSAARGGVLVMDLYLVPHGQMVMNAVNAFRVINPEKRVVTVGEAVGSDVTNVVSNAIEAGAYGAAQLVLSNMLDHDVPVAVSDFTKQVIVEAAEKVDAAMGSCLAMQLENRVEVVYPAIDTAQYLGLADDPRRTRTVLDRYGLEEDGFVLFLSRVAPAKGVDDLVKAFRASRLRGRKDLVIGGAGPQLDEIKAMTENDRDICVLGSVSEDDKEALMQACFAYALPSKPCVEFTETFGIALVEKMLASGSGVVITTRTGGIPEATGGCCLEHEPGDVAGIKDCLNQVLGMGDGARGVLALQAKTYAKRFDKSVAFGRILELAGVDTRGLPMEDDDLAERAAV
jgi:glycosyltransferase involved in cell wall biosynthesis